MLKMNRKCCECNQIVWPGSQSRISFSKIHLRCHQKLIKDLARNPGLAAMLRAEINRFENSTGIKTGLSTAVEGAE